MKQLKQIKKTLTSTEVKQMLDKGNLFVVGYGCEESDYVSYAIRYQKGKSHLSITDEKVLQITGIPAGEILCKFVKPLEGEKMELISGRGFMSLLKTKEVVTYSSTAAFAINQITDAVDVSLETSLVKVFVEERLATLPDNQELFDSNIEFDGVA